eukprot:jgi/Ulvmu1/9231/UM005_0331.1
MVCPLRFVLAGLSAAIVLFLAVDMLWLSQKDDVYSGIDDEDEVPDSKDSPATGQRRAKLPMPKSILDCFTGRYLYQVYGVWRKEASRQQEISDAHKLTS